MSNVNPNLLLLHPGQPKHIYEKERIIIELFGIPILDGYPIYKCLSICSGGCHF
jgi:hypothetical protein